MSDEAKILRFLQKCKLNLMEEIPGFVDARLAPDGTKMILRVSSPLATPPVLEFEEEKIPFEIVVDFPDSKPVDRAVVMADSMSPAVQVPISQSGPIGTVLVPPELAKVAIGPHADSARDPASLEAWKERHKHVKVVK